MCRTKRPDAQMVRMGRRVDGTWYVGRESGRGAWLCRRDECASGVRTGHLARALRSTVSEQDVVLVQELHAHCGLDQR